MWTRLVVKLLKKSSSYNLFIFSSGANSQGPEIIMATSGDSSLSNGELWPDIDKLDEVPCEDTFVMLVRDALGLRKRSTASVENATGRS
jgi:hypothetical protein